MAKNQEKKTDGFEQIEEATISTEQFIEKHQKLIVRGILAVLLVVVLIFSYNRLYKEPRANEALDQIAGAERYFAQDSFRMALYGDGNSLGFLDIIDKYASTPSGKLAHYYAGLSFLQLGEFQQALPYLKKYTPKDRVFAHLVKANIGDAYLELGDYKQAADAYRKAAEGNTNEMTAPMILMKAGLAYEKAGDYKNALAMYERIEKSFTNSMEYEEIEKYIVRAKAQK